VIHCELVPVVRVKFLVLHVRFLEEVIALVIVGIGDHRAAISALPIGPVLQHRPLKFLNQSRLKVERTFVRAIQFVSCIKRSDLLAAQSRSHAHVSSIADRQRVLQCSKSTIS